MCWYTENYLNSEEWDLAYSLARGYYQRDLLEGRHNLAGSSLRGTAKRYSGRYAVSRDNLLARLDAKGISWSEYRGKHGRRILVLGDRPSR